MPEATYGQRPEEGCNLSAFRRAETTPGITAAIPLRLAHKRSGVSNYFLSALRRADEVRLAPIEYSPALEPLSNVVEAT